MYDSFDRNVPVFLQIKDRLKSDILNGVFSPRDKIPSVRQLALDMSVNPNTVQRALYILEEEGLIVTEGTTGKFVTDDDGLIEKCRLELREKALDSWLRHAHSLGITDEEIINFIERGRK